MLGLVERLDEHDVVDASEHVHVGPDASGRREEQRPAGAAGRETGDVGGQKIVEPARRRRRPKTRTLRRSERSANPRPRSSAARSCANASWSAIPFLRHYRRRGRSGDAAGDERLSAACRGDSANPRGAVACAAARSRRRCSAPTGTTRPPTTRRRRFGCSASPSASCGRRRSSPTASRRRRGRWAREVLLFGAAYPLALLGPRLAARGPPVSAAAHGFEYWLSIAPGAHALMRYATSPGRARAGDVLGVHRAHRSHGRAARGAGVGAVSGRGRDAVPTRPRRRRPCANASGSPRVRSSSA